MNPDAVDMDDVIQSFEHMNSNSYLIGLSHQRLAMNLNEAREGLKHDYVVVGITLGDLRLKLEIARLYT